MKAGLFISICIFFLSCTTVKVAQVQSELKPTSEGFVYENDSIKITYQFWAEGGRMQYDIYNKLNIPLYIDWKTSAYIPNDKMVSYWRDETNTEAVSSGYYYHKGFTSSATKMKAIRMERIGVIPPESMITQQSYVLIKKYYDIPDKGTFDKLRSPLRFRNYIMIAGNEKFDGKVTAINNYFYVSFIKESKSNKYMKFKSPTWFYFDKKV